MFLLTQRDFLRALERALASGDHWLMIETLQAGKHHYERDLKNEVNAVIDVYSEAAGNLEAMVAAVKYEVGNFYDPRGF